MGSLRMEGGERTPCLVRAMRSGSWLQAKWASGQKLGTSIRTGVHGCLRQRYLGTREIPEYKRALSRRRPTNCSKVAGKSSKPNGASPSPSAGVLTEPSDNGSYNELLLPN